MSTYRNLYINDRPPQLVDSGFFADIRFDPNDNAPTYIGLHPTMGVSTSDTNWKIYKLTTASTFTTRYQLTYGMWDVRNTLF